MRKGIIVVLVVVCMTLFGSLAVAGDDWQDGFAKAHDQNDLSGAMTLAYNSQASPQAVCEALEAFVVEREEVEESMLLAENPCRTLCALYVQCCCNASPCQGSQDICETATQPPCKCTCPE